jgi:spore coat polysaccharide biosynthesis protein SpsF (cytidylyltransferase family)
VQGKRLYGKPLQNLAPGKTILDQILDTMERLPEIETSVLGIAEGAGNEPFVAVAKARGIAHIIGDEIDVLARLIQCGHAAKATDVFRVTTECPFLYSEPLARAWQRHVENDNDVTVTDGLPEGTHFEIYKLSALETSHQRGNEHHRSEGCSRYIRQHRADFKVETMGIPTELQRMDLRLTVDYPEDLVLCREVYQALADKAPLIPLADIIAFVDGKPKLKELVGSYVKPALLWPQPADA